MYCCLFFGTEDFLLTFRVWIVHWRNSSCLVGWIPLSIKVDSLGVFFIVSVTFESGISKTNGRNFPTRKQK